MTEAAFREYFPSHNLDSTTIPALKALVIGSFLIGQLRPSAVVDHPISPVRMQFHSQIPHLTCTDLFVRNKYYSGLCNRHFVFYNCRSLAYRHHCPYLQPDQSARSSHHAFGLRTLLLLRLLRVNRPRKLRMLKNCTINPDLTPGETMTLLKTKCLISEGFCT
jgi:hypothetical protein